MKGLCKDQVWVQLEDKLAIVSDELFAHFAEQACEVAQHIKIDDTTGTVAKGALFNQENVPSEALFYSVVSAQPGKGSAKDRTPDEAMIALGAKLSAPAVGNLLQLGADETTGLGWCSTTLVG
jgi:CRISPR-associated protein Cmr4